MWWALGAVASVTVVLMCGLSASFLFAIVPRLVEREVRFSPELGSLAGEREYALVNSSARQETENKR